RRPKRRRSAVDRLFCLHRNSGLAYPVERAFRPALGSLIKNLGLQPPNIAAEGAAGLNPGSLRKVRRDAALKRRSSRSGSHSNSGTASAQTRREFRLFSSQIGNVIVLSFQAECALYHGKLRALFLRCKLGFDIKI